MKVLADRGFKNCQEMLRAKGVELIRPPSVSKKQQPSQEDVIYSKQISSLRINVEILIGQIRAFKFVDKHAMIPTYYWKYIDDALVIAAGIVNLRTGIFSNEFIKYE